MQGVVREMSCQPYFCAVFVVFFSLASHSTQSWPLVGFVSEDTQSNSGQREQSLRQCHVIEPILLRYSGMLWGFLLKSGLSLSGWDCVSTGSRD